MSGTAIAAKIVISASGAAVTLASVVSAESLQSGLLTAGDINVSALTQSVRGYRIGERGTIRSAIEPLQQAFPFDVVQRGYKIAFIPRGGASVATLANGDLDARSGQQGDGVQITSSREMDSQLPQRVTVQYLDSTREYDVSSEYAECPNVASVNSQSVQLPLVLLASEAAGVAEVLLYAAWLRRQLSFRLPGTYLQLEPSDVVTLPTPEGNISARLMSIQYTSDGRLECRAALDNPAVYTPAALGAAPNTTGITTIAPLGVSTYALLDIPWMMSVQDSVGFPLAMCGSNSAWPGGVLHRSVDNGVTWDALLDGPPPGATIGVASGLMGAVESRLIDAASRLTVTLVNGSLSDVSDALLLGGANHFAYGADGRWEIIGARTCTLQSGTTYVLSNFLRGRFGTEWTMGSHASGDQVILLDAGDLEFVGVGSGEIGQARLFRAITSGRDLSTDSNRSMAYRGVNLRPLSPVYANGEINPSTNDWVLTCIRRTRTGGEWKDYVDASLGEASESYAIDVYADGSYTTIKRTITASAPFFIYASADQIADFGANQTTLYFKLYQISATVGRGYPLTTSLTR